MGSRTDAVPWWASAALAFVFSMQVTEHGGNFAGDGIAGWPIQPKPRKETWRSPPLHGRFLGSEDKESEDKNKDGDHKAEDEAVANANQAVDEAADALLDQINVTLEVPCVLTFIEPCGNVTIPDEGLTFKTLFGKYYVPGADSLEDEVVTFKHAFSKYTVLAVIIGFIAWFLGTVLIPSRRKKMVKSVRDVFSGKVEDDDDEDMDPPTPEELEQQKQERLDPKSADFIAPGNIYRLLAVLHPGIIGYWAWSSYAMKAFICAYMQIMLPCKFIGAVFHKWDFYFIKSPLWFLTNCFTFASMFAALGSLCNLFACKCANNIMAGAEANFHILSHRCPQGTQQATSQTDDGYQGLLARPPIPHIVITINERFWCYFSILMNVAMSMLLQLTMFLRVATFSGEVQEASRSYQGCRGRCVVVFRLRPRRQSHGERSQVEAQVPQGRCEADRGAGGKAGVHDADRCGGH